MGRKKVKYKRMNTTVTIRIDLKEKAKEMQLNLSKMLEKAIQDEIERHEEIYKK